MPRYQGRPYQVQPWDALQQLIFRPSGRTGSLCTAVGMNLSMHGEPQPTVDEWAEPFMEVEVHDDDSYSLRKPARTSWRRVLITGRRGAEA